MSAIRLDRILDEADAILRRTEDAQLRVIDAGLRRALRDLEVELKRIIAIGVDRSGSAALVEARARALAAQLDTVLSAFSIGEPGTGIPQAVRATIASAHEQGLADVDTVLRRMERRVPLSPSLDLAAVEAAAANSAARLARHGANAIATMQEHVIAGLMRGEGVRKTTAKLRAATGMLRSHAERIVRTESISALDEARRAGYQANGVAYVQRLGTLDGRICGYCLARHGNVYKAAEAPAVLHPYDRCANMPFRFEWLRDGLIDVAWFRQSRVDLAQRAIEPARHGAAPFEKAAGREPPRVYWRVPE
jgi:SPP1 gp7 family putative phage head morphogenesis protein